MKQLEYDLELLKGRIERFCDATRYGRVLPEEDSLYAHLMKRDLIGGDDSLDYDNVMMNLFRDVDPHASTLACGRMFLVDRLAVADLDDRDAFYAQLHCIYCTISAKQGETLKVLDQMVAERAKRKRNPEDVTREHATQLLNIIGESWEAKRWLVERPE